MPKEKPKNQSSEKRQQKEIDPKDIQGLKYFKVLRPFLIHGDTVRQHKPEDCSECKFRTR